MKFKEKNKKQRKPFGLFFYLLDINYLASLATSWMFHAALLLIALFMWTETLDVDRRTHRFNNMSIHAVYDFEKDEEDLEESEDVGEREDIAKRAEGEEGEFGDPDI